MPSKNTPPSASVDSIVHTPGPWKCERLIDNTGKPYATIYVCHIDLGPCMIWAPPGNAEQEANARLIAECPEMFAIVKRLATVDWMSEKELSMWIRKCREIVAKVV